MLLLHSPRTPTHQVSKEMLYWTRGREITHPAILQRGPEPCCEGQRARLGPYPLLAAAPGIVALPGDRQDNDYRLSLLGWMAAGGGGVAPGRLRH